MRKLITYLVVTMVAAVLASTASGHPSKCSAHQHGKTELKCGVRAYYWGRGGVRWYKTHTTRSIEGKTAAQIHAELLLRMKWERKGRYWIRQARHRLARRRLVSYHPAASLGFPPHHALWMCLHSVEAGSWYDHDSGGSGHYGGLQMHWNWGYGIVGDAGNYSQAQQEWAAERAYKASGYSPSFIYGQWLEWENGYGNKCITLE